MRKYYTFSAAREVDRTLEIVTWQALLYNESALRAEECVVILTELKELMRTSGENIEARIRNFKTKRLSEAIAITANLASIRTILCR